MRNHWIACLYCRGSHPTQAEWRECADKVIAAEVEEWRRDHAEMDAELAQAADELQDCADAPPEFFNPQI